LDYLGMTGRFSETWGHFNSYKPQAALEYECFLMLALGGKCSVGDQLHPRGILDAATYELIGSVYSQVEAVEPWCRGARGVAEIAVVNAEEFDHSSERMDPRNLGAARMLIESRHQFDFIDSGSDLSGYKVLVLPDVIPLEGEFRERVDKFIAEGGAMIASGHSGFGLDGFPAEAVGNQLSFSPDFLRTELAGRPDTDYVMYERGTEVRATEGAEVLAKVSVPYFERSYDRFVSHAHTPVEKSTEIPGVLQKGEVVYFAHPIFTTYAKHSMPFHRDVVMSALRRLLPVPLVEAEGPTTLQANLTELPDGRQVVHLLHYVPERRGLNFEIVEDRLPLHHVPVSVKGEWTPILQPQGEALSCEHQDGRTRFTVPIVDGHQIVELQK